MLTILSRFPELRLSAVSTGAGKNERSKKGNVKCRGNHLSCGIIGYGPLSNN
jgi:hypothetical protein